MSAQREELLQLVEELPETEVPAMLDNVYRHLREGQNKSWPPAWFGAGRAVDLVQRPGPRSCSSTGSAVRRDPLCTGPLVATAPRSTRRASSVAQGC